MKPFVYLAAIHARSSDAGARARVDAAPLPAPQEKPQRARRAARLRRRLAWTARA